MKKESSEKASRKYGHAEVREIKTICDISPDDESTAEVCREVKDEKITLKKDKK